MALRARMWTSGAAVRSQESGPDYFLPVDDNAGSVYSGVHRGFASTFRVIGGREVWFHLPIPTPSVLPGADKLWLDEVTLLWDASGGASIQWITLHHGGLARVELTPMAQPIADDPAPQHDHRDMFQRQRTDLPVRPRLAIEMGLQMAIMVRASEAAGDVRFFGAGASFVDVERAA